MIEEFKGEIVTNLKDRLDEINAIALNLANEGFYNSRLIIEVGMWYKGEAINKDIEDIGGQNLNIYTNLILVR